ncbi:cation transporter [Anaerovorax odorimutans]|uniref:Cation transporter n=1 Tax=Anaerovorax odorimutans TaxID=109327 RepID=A0ABT1RRI5_9FIRM|nr:cation transporter [Anaerovorax odorimutans]
MDDSLRLEKRILKLSFAGSAAFLLAECIMAFITGSHAVLMDCVYDIADIVMLGPFMILVPLLYKPVSEKRPYGFSQVESLFIIIKCGLLIFITAQLIVESVQMILDGGHIVNAGVIAAFELGVSACCVIMYFTLNHLNKKYSSPTVKAELYIWKLDALSTMGVGAAFLIQLVLQRTPLVWLSPYIDPGIAVIMAVILLKEPLSMFIEGIKNLILFAPKKEVMEHVRKVADDCLAKYHFDINFVDVIKTGRKIWIEIYILQEDDLISISDLKQARSDMMEELEEDYNQVYIGLIPEIDAVQSA